jgi:GxxExxY protein
VAVDCGYRLHVALGPGLLESVYATLLADGLRRRGLSVEGEVWLDAEWEGVVVPRVCRIDLYVERSLIIEVKSVEQLAPVHGKQLLTYLRLAKQPLGLLMNFGAATFKEGLKRVVNNHASARFGGRE